MGRFDLPETYAVNFARQSVRDSLMSHGEMSIAFAAFHPSRDKDAERYRCPHYDDIYKEKRGDGNCRSCYNTSYTRFKEIARVWAVFTDSPNQEKSTKTGSYTPALKSVHTEFSPELMSGDYIVRVSYWDGRTPLVVEEVYEIDDVQPESLRTGARFGQAYYDVVGQKLQVHREPDTHSLYSYPFKELTL